jgi:hypothetical protein
MGQFLAPKGQILPTTIADVKTRIRRAEHKIEALQSTATDTGGVEITFSDDIPDSANVGDIWYQTSDSSVIGEYQCATAYTSGNGTLDNWTAYTTDGSSITEGTVANAQLATDSVSTANLQDSSVTLATIDTTDVTARTLGGNIVTVGTTEPTDPVNGDLWIETDSDGNVESFWNYNGTWVESTIAIPTSSGIEVTASTTAPTSPNTDDLWINESEGNLLEQWNGTEWVSFQFGAGSIANAAVGTAQLASSVTARAIGANNITVGTTAPSSPLIGDEWIQTNSSGSTVGIYTYGANAKATPIYVGDLETTTAATSAQVPVSAPVPYGSKLVVLVIAPNTTSQTITVSDTEGNTYTGSSVTGTGMQQWTFSASNVNALWLTDSITVTSTVSETMAVVVLAVPGGASIAGAPTASGASTAPSIGTYSGTVVGDVQLVLFANIGGKTIASTPSGYTSFGHFQATGGTLAIDAVWQTATAAGTATVASTYATSTDWTAAAVSLAYSADSWNSSLSLDAAVMLADSSITQSQLANSAVGASAIASGALDGMAISAPVINGGTINATDFIITPGTDAYILGYGTPGSGTYTQTLTGTGKWTPPTGVTEISALQMMGAGGGGGCGAEVYNHGGGGGGGGAFAQWNNVAVTAGTAYAYSVGAGGTAGTGTDGDGGTGGNGAATTMTIGSVTYTANGGTGGGYSTSSTTNAVGGAGGTVTTANSPAATYPGGAGGSTAHFNGAGGGSSAGTAAKGVVGNSVSASLGSASGAGGTGPAGSGNGGSGGYAGSNTNYPTQGNFPGGGGGGGAGSLTNPTAYQSGAAGADGAILITYTIPAGTEPELLLSVSPVVGSDSASSSTVEDGFTTYYETARMQMHVNQTNSCPALEMYTGVASEYGHPSIYAVVSNEGSTTAEIESLFLQGPASTSDGESMYQYFSNNNAGGTTTPFIVFESSANGSIAWFDSSGFTLNSRIYAGNGASLWVDKPIYITDPSNSAQDEAWHTITLDSGWTTVSGHPVPQYRMLPDGNIQLAGFAESSTAATSGSPVNLNSGHPLPSAYWPATTHLVTGDQNRGAWEYTSAGVIKMYWSGLPTTGSTQIEMANVLPLI